MHLFTVVVKGPCFPFTYFKLFFPKHFVWIKGLGVVLRRLTQSKHWCTEVCFKYATAMGQEGKQGRHFFYFFFFIKKNKTKKDEIKKHSIRHSFIPCICVTNTPRFLFISVTLKHHIMYSISLVVQDNFHKYTRWFTHLYVYYVHTTVSICACFAWPVLRKVYEPCRDLPNLNYAGSVPETPNRDDIIPSSHYSYHVYEMIFIWNSMLSMCMSLPRLCEGPQNVNFVIHPSPHGEVQLCAAHNVTKQENGSFWEAVWID